MMKNNQKKNKGFVLLFSVLISSLVLAVGISVISIALKQVVLSGSGRDSQYAFYVANTGAECALFWDLAGDPGTIVNDNNSPVFSINGSDLKVPSAEVKCLTHWLRYDPNNPSQIDSQPQCPVGTSGDRDPALEPGWCVLTEGLVTQTKFRIAYSDRSYCADVIISKTIDSTGLVTGTKITSRGYNTCDDQNPRRIERALEFNY